LPTDHVTFLALPVYIIEKSGCKNGKNLSYKVDNVEFVPIKPREGLVGFASCILNGNLYLGGIGVHTNLKDGSYRITFPTKKVGEHNVPLYHPIDDKLREAISKAVVEKVEKLMEVLCEERKK